MANIYLNAKKDLTTNSATTVYTVPSNSRAILKSMYVSEDTGNADTITVVLFAGDPASADSFSLYKTKAVGANATEQLITEPIIMMENEVLQVTAATANRLHVTLSVLEINRD
tara:strand:- start:44 stop:382 length:339 start_codon:yes stop_codon:yes gene_type:complete